MTRKPTPRKCHYLKKNKTGQVPRNWLFVDTETTSTRSDEVQSLRIKLGVACFVRLAPDLTIESETWLDFDDPGEFWIWAMDRVERDRRTILTAYNLAFDIRILDGFRRLASLGYRSEVPYVSDTTTILRWHLAKHSLIGVDATNYFDGSLDEWGDLVGKPKLSVDFARGSRPDLAAYCRRDVEILRELTMWWLRFCRDHDLGVWSVTKSSQAMNAFRHRFMTTRILVHVNPEVIALERASYVGGRVECFHLGRVPGGPFWKLDVNSHYPAIMRDLPLPFRLHRLSEECTVEELETELTDHEVIANVDLETDTPLYPVRGEGGLTFPVGRFSASLAGPELRLAVARGHIRRVGYAASYRTAILFADFVDYFYRLKVEYGEAGDWIRQRLAKYLMNCLSGKWGQKAIIWEESKMDTFDEEGETLIFAWDRDTSRSRIVLCGQVWEQVGEEEGFNSFPAIVSTITSEGRVRLASLIERAGWDHCYYCDTDSVIVDRVGRDRLAHLIDPKALGGLSVEGASDSLTIHAPKWYALGSDLKIKGVPKKRREIAPDTFRVETWQGLRGWLHSGEHGVVKITDTVKRLARDYVKGSVSSSGSVSPPRLDEIAD